MSVHEARKGAWSIQVYGRRRSGGTRPKLRETFHGGKGQSTREVQFKAAHDAGRRIGDTSTVAEYAEVWLVARDVRGCTHRAVEHHRTHLEGYVLPTIGHVRMTEVSPPDVQVLHSEVKRRAFQGRRAATFIERCG